MNNIICEINDEAIKAIIDLAQNAESPANNHWAGWTNVIIVLIVCVFLLFIAKIVFKSVTQWKNAKQQDEKCKREEERKREEEARKTKLLNDYRAKVLEHKEKELDEYEQLLKKLKELKDKNSKENPQEEAILELLNEGIECLENHESSAKGAYVNYLENCIGELI